MSGRKHKAIAIPRWRFLLAAFALVVLAVSALWHIAGLQVLDSDRGFRFLQKEGQARTMRLEPIPAYRGVITDRRGEPLAVSAPVISIWANPQVVATDARMLTPLAKRLGVSHTDIKARIARFADKEFVYFARELSLDDAEKILALGVAGVYGQQEYRRFYPTGEVAAQLVGFNNVDDNGQEGMELAYDKPLEGKPGARRVIKDRKGRVIRDLGLVRSEKSGSNLALSIDLRLQYLAYRELKAAMTEFHASSGCMVVLDARTGEVLAMVNQPSFNPNGRSRRNLSAMRNRAVADIVEPGSLMKPLTMVAALESGKFDAHTPIDTSPGYIRVAGKTFRDPVNYGQLDVTGVITKSSQVGLTKVAMELSPESVRNVFDRVGLGQSPGTGFPGESSGSLPEKRRWHSVERATYAFGYGMQATALQLARAYAVIAAEGVRRPVTLLRMDSAVAGDQVIEPGIARAVREMMKTVTQPGGTGTRAAVPGYQVAGKTGTVHRVGVGGYQKDRYTSLFAGMVPADDPRLVAVVIINEPQGKHYFGGLVAAPVFGKVMAEALRMLRIPPELPEGQRVVVMGAQPKPEGI